ncbi:MAG TPA: TlpA disulfide reductase family protein [Flavobacterium sp.]|nr:TlpA disulfide reductase family protein [Flavobacterium sp.]
MLKIKNIITLLCLVGAVSFGNAQIKKGDSLPSISLKNDKNATVNLNSFKGKVVLVDFWASWCAPCRKANKSLVKLYNQYKNQNFEIVGISIDTKKEQWLRAISKDKMTHKQLIDPFNFEAKSAQLFGVDALPAAYLFDTNGKLVTINPTEAQIIALIKKNKK